MSDEDTAQEGSSEGEAHWTTGHEEFASDETVGKAVAKFDSPYALGKSYAELEKKLGSSFKIPDDVDKMPEDQRAKLMERVSALTGAPKSVEDYQIEMPEAVEGLEWSDDLMTAVKEAAFEGKVSPSALQAISKVYTDKLISQANEQIEARNQALDTYRKELGNAASDVLGTVDSKGNVVELGTAQKAGLALSKELGLDYTDEQGNSRSQLLDCLENTRLGDRIPMVKVFNYIHEKLFAEGSPTASAGGAETGKSFFDYEGM